MHASTPSFPPSLSFFVSISLFPPQPALRPSPFPLLYLSVNSSSPFLSKPSSPFDARFLPSLTPSLPASLPAHCRSSGCSNSPPQAGPTAPVAAAWPSPRQASPDGLYVSRCMWDEVKKGGRVGGREGREGREGGEDAPTVMIPRCCAWERAALEASFRN